MSAFDFDHLPAIRLARRLVEEAGRAFPTAAENLSYEVANQEKVANHPTWLIARETNTGGDSRARLEALGLTITAEYDDLFYTVERPDGWTKTTSGYWTTFYDGQGDVRLMMFFKGASYDTQAFIG